LQEKILLYGKVFSGPVKARLPRGSSVGQVLVSKGLYIILLARLPRGWSVGQARLLSAKGFQIKFSIFDCRLPISPAVRLAGKNQKSAIIKLL